jgi:hypothetical protein
VTDDEFKSALIGALVDVEMALAGIGLELEGIRHALGGADDSERDSGRDSSGEEEQR